MQNKTKISAYSRQSPQFSYAYRTPVATAWRLWGIAASMFACSIIGGSASWAAPNDKATSKNTPAQSQFLAVLEFSGEGVSKATLQILSDYVRQAAVNELPRGISVMTRENQETMLRAFDVDLSKCDVNGCEVDLLKTIQATYGITGNVAVVGSLRVATIKLYDVEKGAVLRIETAKAPSEELLLDEVNKAATLIIRNALGKLGGDDDDNSDLPVGVIGKKNNNKIKKDDGILVNFSSEPAGAVVRVDGTLVCQATPCTQEVKSGPHEVVMEKVRYKQARSNVDISDAQKNVSLSLPPNFGKLRVVTEPSSLQVSVNGQKATSPYATELDQGNYRVLLDDPCYEEAGEAINLRIGDDKEIKIKGEPRLSGIKVLAKDAAGNAVEADVTVDGVVMGKTYKTLEVPKCSKRVEVRLPDGTYWDQALSLTEGNVSEFNAEVVKKKDPDPSVVVPAFGMKQILRSTDVITNARYRTGVFFTTDFSLFVDSNPHVTNDVANGAAPPGGTGLSWQPGLAVGFNTNGVRSYGLAALGYKGWIGSESDTSMTALYDGRLDAGIGFNIDQAFYLDITNSLDWRQTLGNRYVGANGLTFALAPAAIGAVLDRPRNDAGVEISTNIDGLTAKFGYHFIAERWMPGVFAKDFDAFFGNLSISRWLTPTSIDIEQSTSGGSLAATSNPNTVSSLVGFLDSSSHQVYASTKYGAGALDVDLIGSLGVYNNADRILLPFVVTAGTKLRLADNLSADVTVGYGDVLVNNITSTITLDTIVGDANVELVFNDHIAFRLGGKRQVHAVPIFSKLVENKAWADLIISPQDDFDDREILNMIRVSAYATALQFGAEATPSVFSTDKAAGERVDANFGLTGVWTVALDQRDGLVLDITGNADWYDTDAVFTSTDINTSETITTPLDSARFQLMLNFRMALDFEELD